jgi:hypothetical protein
MGSEDRLAELVAKNRMLILDAKNVTRRSIALRTKWFELSQAKWWAVRHVTVVHFTARGLRLGNQLRRLGHESAALSASSCRSSASRKNVTI